MPLPLQYTFGFLKIPDAGSGTILTYYIIFTGIISYVVVYYALKHLEASVAGVLTGLIPISGILLSIFFLGETVSAMFVLGAAISLIGMYITTKKEHKK